MNEIPTLALFDLDGTLVHHENDHFYQVIQYLFEKLGHRVPSRAEFDQGVKKHDLFWYVDKEARPEFEEKFWRSFDQISFPEPRLIDGSLETLEHFVSNGSRVAIVTARTHQRHLVEENLRHSGLLKYIELVSTLATSYDSHHPELEVTPLKYGQILAVCKQFGARPEDTIIAGDTPHDILSGRAAGLRVTIGLRSGGLEEEILVRCDPHLLLDDISHMPGYFPAAYEEGTAEKR